MNVESMTTRFLPLFVLVFLLVGIQGNGMSQAKSLDELKAGREILEGIEPAFTGEPIFLNPDVDFKNRIKSRLATAIEYLERANEQEQTEEGLFLLGKAYSFGHDLDMPGAAEQSVHYLTRLIGINPDHALAHIFLGKNYMDGQRFEDAFKEYEIADGLSPNGFALRNMALVRMFQKRTSEGQKLMEEYLRHNPADDNARTMLQAIKSGNVEKVER